MKKLQSKLVYLFAICLLVIGAGQRVQAQDVTVSYQTFYDDLSPYGQWVSDPQYGNVWVPNEGGDFRPYGTHGHWAMTDYGNTWVSDDSWGWAPYHYGRWTYDPYYGWVWIPGYEWAPAWVSWRFGGGNCGWAPLGPGINAGVAYNCPDSWWVFVGPQYMYQDNCIHYWRGPSYNGGYIRQTNYVTNVYVDNGTHVRYNYGPRADAIQGVTHQPVQVYKVSRGERPGAPSISGNRVSMYRPAVNRATATTARPGNVINAPRQIGKPQAAPNVNAGKAAPFRQQMQNGTINRGNAASQQGNRGQQATPQTRQQPAQQQQQQRTQQAQQQQRTQQAQQQQQRTQQTQQHSQQAQQQQQRAQQSQQHSQQAQQQQQRSQQAQQQQQRSQQAQQQQQRSQQAQQQQQRSQQAEQQQQRSQQQAQQQEQRSQQMQQQQQQRAQPMQGRPQAAPQQHEEQREGGGGRR